MELSPRYANAYNTRGNIWNRTGDLARALGDYNRAIELAPNDSLTYNNRAAIFFKLKRYDEARADVYRCRQLGGTPHEGLVRALNEGIAPR
jgi:tetratricopeptide (TPR) repeat protein